MSAKKTVGRMKQAYPGKDRIINNKTKLTVIAISLILILLTTLVSCSEDQITEMDDDDEINDSVSDSSNAGYSGVTEVDENMHFRSIDPDDWRDDGILTECLAYPNPLKVTAVSDIQEMYNTCKNLLTVRYKVPKTYLAAVMRDPNGHLVHMNLVPRVKNDKDERESITPVVAFSRTPAFYTCFMHYPSWDALDRPIVEPYVYTSYFCVGFWNTDGTEYEPPKYGIYRLFIYASDSEFMMQMLRETGVTNVPREKYSMVYGDVLITK